MWNRTREGKTSGSNPWKNLDRLDRLLEPDWEEDSQVTVNVNHPVIHPTPSQFDKLKAHMKLPTKKQAGIGGIVVVIIGALVKIAQELGWVLQ